MHSFLGIPTPVLFGQLTLGFLPVKVERPERIFQTRAKEHPDMFTGMAHEHSPTVPRIWSDFIAHALQPKREKRFASAEHMLADLRAIAPALRTQEATGIPDVPVPFPPPYMGQAGPAGPRPGPGPGLPGTG